MTQGCNFNFQALKDFRASVHVSGVRIPHRYKLRKSEKRVLQCFRCPLLLPGLGSLDQDFLLGERAVHSRKSSMTSCCTCVPPRYLGPNAPLSLKTLNLKTFPTVFLKRKTAGLRARNTDGQGRVRCHSVQCFAGYLFAQR